jgi:plasmid maintenance system antidote protein VapI
MAYKVLEKEIKEKGVSLNTLADAIGVNSSILVKRRLDKPQRFSIDEAFLVAKALDTSIDIQDLFKWYE